MNVQTISGVDESWQVYAKSYSNVVDKAVLFNGVTTDGNGNFEIRVTGFHRLR
jgi:hypothetical protein